MLAKPSKHGIKVFAVCCAMTVIILGFTIYVWEGGDCDNTALNVCDILLQNAGFTGRRGCVLYTDNYYTLVKLSEHFFVEYRWTLVGTINTTDKKSHQDCDIPFLKLSNGARKTAKRGCFHM